MKSLYAAAQSAAIARDRKVYHAALQNRALAAKHADTPDSRLGAYTYYLVARRAAQAAQEWAQWGTVKGQRAADSAELVADAAYGRYSDLVAEMHFAGPISH